MKKIILSLLIICFFVCITICTYGEEWETFTGSGPYFNYTINYPSDWRAENMYGFAVFLTPSAKSDNFRENVSVTVADISKKPIDLEKFDSVWLKFVVHDQVSNFMLLNKGETTIDGKKALFYVYTGSEGSTKLKCRRYSFLTKLNIYELEYKANEEDYDKYLSQVERIIESIKVE